MSNERLYISVLCLVAALAVCSILQAGEHCGVVRLGDQPVPGATVAAIQAEKRFAAVTDEAGTYCFADLPDGTWTIRVEMPGFAPAEREIPVSSTQAVAEWPMKVLPYAEMQALAPAAVPPAPQTTAAPVKPEQQPAVSAKDTRRARTAPMPQVANTPSAPALRVNSARPHPTTS
jgi:hypothetical protein